ncbi:hypothetical protein Drorol1_Dr00025745, partial [Drosera rotundifolia]
WIMDTSNPPVFVNGGLLRMLVGRKVCAVIQVMRNDVGSVVGKSTDDQQIIVKSSPSQPLSAWVEVIGVADSTQSIRADIWTNFGDNFVDELVFVSGLIMRFSYFRVLAEM